MLDVATLFIVTNNDKVLDKYHDYNIKYIDSESMYDVFITARDLIHKGYKLLTHPMSSSLKANQTPYKSILMLKKNDGINFEDLQLIENAIENYNKFRGCPR